jgi:hypothetical protein
VLWHDLRLALRSIQRNPLLAALIVAVIAVGIATSVVAITLYHAKAGNPIWWKEDVLYRVMLDSRPAIYEGDKYQRHPEYPPFSIRGSGRLRVHFNRTLGRAAYPAAVPVCAGRWVQRAATSCVST